MNMKKTRFIAYTMGLLLAVATFQACSDDDDKLVCVFPVPQANALVTVKPQGDGKAPVLQLDDEVQLTPTNLDKSPFGDKEVRALCNLRFEDNPADKYHQKVFVNWIDSILTKKMAPDMGSENDNVYGNDPVEIVRDWVTVAEDGYLTLRFRTRWGDNKAHWVNLVENTRANHYELEFHHKGNVNGPVGDGLVAFKLSDIPQAGTQPVQITLRWMSFSGEKSISFNYQPGKSTGGTAVLVKEADTTHTIH